MSLEPSGSHQKNNYFSNGKIYKCLKIIFVVFIIVTLFNFSPFGKIYRYRGMLNWGYENWEEYECKEALEYLVKHNQTNYIYIDTEGENLSGANLEGAVFSTDNFSEANLSGANLQDAYLKLCDIIDVNLEDGNLEGAYFEGGNLEGSNLSRANLRNVNFENVLLFEVDFRGANLDGVQFKDSAMSGAMFLPTDSIHMLSDTQRAEIVILGPHDRIESIME